MHRAPFPSLSIHLTAIITLAMTPALLLFSEPLAMDYCSSSHIVIPTHRRDMNYFKIKIRLWHIWSLTELAPYPALRNTTVLKVAPKFYLTLFMNPAFSQPSLTQLSQCGFTCWTLNMNRVPTEHWQARVLSEKAAAVSSFQILTQIFPLPHLDFCSNIFSVIFL